MIDRKQLLADLQKLLVRLEADLLERSESAEVPQVGETLRADYEQAKAAARTAQNYEDWRSDAITQAAAAWVLSCVFVRFLEDNRLIEPPKIAGPGERLRQARDEWELYLTKTAAPNERDYLLSVFDALAALPGTKDVFGAHNPIRELPNWLSGDAARDLLNFFQKIDAETGLLVHDFTDPDWDTRFLGDLYQDLSEAARKKYALLQTPDFVEAFILDRTLEPALDEFGLDAPPVLGIDNQPITEAGFRMIDPACGSGHFLLGGFRRILDRWQRKEPDTKTRELVQRSLDSVVGVDVNPYAVAIARFRLLLAAMRACGITRLADAPAFNLNLACGDSLLHGPGSAVQTTLGDIAEVHHAYQPEDLPLLRKYLTPGIYHAVVANPPYIVPKDRALNEAYRKRYDSCHMKYSLAVPFLERIFRLALTPSPLMGEGRGEWSSEPRTSVLSGAAGYTGQITANSFMKREFGKKVIEEFFPTIDLTHVIDTSLAYIPGHGTPSVILLGRCCRPLSSTVRTVMGIVREIPTPPVPSQGRVWLAILDQIDTPESQGNFVSVSDADRGFFHKHPWSLGGGGAAELKEMIEATTLKTISEVVDSIGVMVVTLEDDAFVSPESALNRAKIDRDQQIDFVEGDVIRDWVVDDVARAIFPYDRTNLEPIIATPTFRRLWPFKTGLSQRLMFSKTQLARGLKWFEYGMFIRDKFRTPLSIAFAAVTANNHFVLERGGRVFKQSAPVIKLPRYATECDHMSLLGALNCSVALFWIAQVFQSKGGSGVNQGVYEQAWERYFDVAGTGLQKFPLPTNSSLTRAAAIDQLARDRSRMLPRNLFATNLPTKELVTSSHDAANSSYEQLIAAQEELDWDYYVIYGLISGDLSTQTPPAIRLGQRAFEICLARKLSSGESQSTWFERHGSTPITELPTHWPKEYKQLVERRIELIENDPNIRLIEQPEYKRRWSAESWESQLKRALREWLLDRLESYFDFDGRMNDAGQLTAKLDVSLVSVAKIADTAHQDADFMQVGELYRYDPAFDVAGLVVELVEAESVPLLPVLRYKQPGLRKRAEWEKTWDLQRREDAGEKVSPIDVPPKYTSADFLKSSYWNLRGKLDVPKERWVSFPHCEGADGTLMIAWAGYDHLQLARAISAHFVDVQERLGGRDDPRLVPLLSCLVELLPWIKQWHNEPDAAFNGMRMFDYFEGFINEEARQLGKTIDEIKAWTPPQRAASARGRRKAAT